MSEVGTHDTIRTFIKSLFPGDVLGWDFDYVESRITLTMWPCVTPDGKEPSHAVFQTKHQKYTVRTVVINDVELRFVIDDDRGYSYRWCFYSDDYKHRRFPFRRVPNAIEEIVL